MIDNRKDSVREFDPEATAKGKKGGVVWIGNCRCLFCGRKTNQHGDGSASSVAVNREIFGRQEPSCQN